jgi:hypothetical protein
MSSELGSGLCLNEVIHSVIKMVKPLAFSLNIRILLGDLLGFFVVDATHVLRRLHHRNLVLAHEV